MVCASSPSKGATWAVGWLLAVALGAGGCASLPHPAPGDVALARSQWPSATLESLVEGRRAYVARCSSCHALYLPTARAAEQWPHQVAQMEKDAKLRPGERELIARFLVTMALRARPRAEGP